jgi:hypothetical protein
MRSSVSPSTLTWSREIEVTIESTGSAALVASSRPPSPTSDTAMSTPAAAKWE